jgi:hypothetical protein
MRVQDGRQGCVGVCNIIGPLRASETIHPIKLKVCIWTICPAMQTCVVIMFRPLLTGRSIISSCTVCIVYAFVHTGDTGDTNTEEDKKKIWQSNSNESCEGKVKYTVYEGTESRDYEEYYETAK